jgi:cell division transport system permease protein
MFWTTTKRIIKAGFVNFWRNGFVSLSSIVVLTTTLLVIAGTLFFSIVLNATLQQIKSQVDINVYFVTSATTSDILAVQQAVQALPEVASVNYISADDALAAFKARHASDELTIQALDELNGNPLGAELNIKAKDPSEYANVAAFLQSKAVSPTDGLPIIDTINYNQNETAINKLTSIITGGRELGLILIIVLVVISLLITYNTTRLAIHGSREEIAVERLVGASSRFVRGPFVIVGIMYGIISALLAVAVLYPISYYLGKVTATFFIGFNIFAYYQANFSQVLLVLLLAGIVIGGISSWIAVRRYLKV